MIQSRKNKGQAIVEGAAILPVMISLVVVLAFAIANASILGTYSYRLNAIAAEGARQYLAGKWWLGMERSGFNVEEARQDVRILVTEELKAMGWKNAKAENIKFETTRTMAGTQELELLQVSFDVSGLDVLGVAGVFPTQTTIHASGIASDGEYAVAPHGVAVIHVVDPPPGNKQRAIRVPVYNATIGNNTSAHGTWLKAGPSLGSTPVVTLNVYCKHDGQLSMQQTRETGGSEILDTADWTGQVFSAAANIGSQSI